MRKEQFIMKFDSPDNIWFTSDTHFGHNNIIRFTKRPWDSIEEMDEGLIKIKALPVGNDTMTIYAKIEPLLGYEVVEEGWEYFKNFPVRVADIFSIEETQEV